MTGQGNAVLRRRVTTPSTTTRACTRRPTSTTRSGRRLPDSRTAPSTTSTTTPRCSSASWSACPTCAPSPTTCRTQLAGYLNKLLGYGVSGFRVDAAKHIGQTDLTRIESRLHRTVDGTVPTSRSRSAPAARAGSHRRPSPAGQRARLRLRRADLESRSRATRPRRSATSATSRCSARQPGCCPATSRWRSCENHDTERNGSTLSYKDGASNTLATEFMLAYGYGTPEVYAGFASTPRRLAAGRRQRLRHRHRLRHRLGVHRPDHRRGEHGRLAQLRRQRAGAQLVRRRRQPDLLQPGQPGLDRINNETTAQTAHLHDRAAARHVLRHHPRRAVARTAAPARPSRWTGTAWPR